MADGHRHVVLAFVLTQTLLLGWLADRRHSRE